MKMEQMDFDFSDSEEKIVIPHSEKKPKHWESSEEYFKRVNELFRKVSTGKYVWAKPTKNELAEDGNERLQDEKKQEIEPTEMHDANLADKLTKHDPDTERKIAQMKKRRDIYD